MTTTQVEFPATTGSLARGIGHPAWQVARMYERGMVTERGRVGGYRIILEEDVPAILSAMVAAGYMAAAEREEILSVIQV